MRVHVRHRGARHCPGARARRGGATFLRRLARSGSCTVVAMVFGAKGRGGPGTAALVLVLAPACASGVGLDDDSGATQVVVSTGGTSVPPPDTSGGTTDPTATSGVVDETTTTGLPTTGDEGTTDASSSGGDEDSTTGEALPHPERYPFDRVHSPISMYVADEMRAIAAAVDADPAVFAKVGGTISSTLNFLQCFAVDAAIQDLPLEPSLMATIAHFRAVDLGGVTAWNRPSKATVPAATSDALLTGMPPPIATEVGEIKPRFAHVLIGTHDLDKAQPEALWQFADNLADAVDGMIGAGVVPIVSTLPRRTDKPETDALLPRYNAVVRAVAQGRQIPLLDLNLAISQLPMSGLGADGMDLSVFVSADVDRPCHFSEAALKFGYNTANLEALRALDRARQVVVDQTPFIDPPGPGLVGDGSPDDPIRVPSLPFVDLRSTTDSPSDAIDSYAGACDKTKDESGPERLYRLDIVEPVAIRVMVFDRGMVDVDVHVLSDATPGTCIKRDDRVVTGPLPEGTYYIAIDSFGGVVPGGASGEYMLVVLAD